MNSQKRTFTQLKGTRLVMTVPPHTIRIMRTVMKCGVVTEWLSARMPGTVIVSLILLIKSELRLIGLQPLVESAAVTAMNAAVLTPGRSVSDETSTAF
jgi:hypothetical protein